MTPTHIVNAGVHLLEWPEHHLSIRVDRIREAPGGTVSAEILARSTNTATPGGTHLTQTRINLTERGRRAQAARELEGVTGWPYAECEGILHDMAVLVLRKYREGEPFHVVGETEIAAEPISYRLEPILIERKANLLWGAGEAGKSTLARYFSVLIESPLNHCGLVSNPGNVLYLDWETDVHEIARQVKLIQQGLEVWTPSNIIYRYCYRPLVDMIEEIRAWVAEHKIDLVVEDALGAACGGEPENANVILEHFRALRSLPVTPLVLHHTNKEGKMFGSEFIFHQCRSIFEVRKAHMDEDSMVIALYNRKRNIGRRVKPLGFRVDFSDDAIRFNPSDVRGIPDLAARLPIRDQIQELLKHGSMAVQDMADEIGKREEVIRTCLNRHTGLFVKLGKEWGLRAEQ